MANRSVARVARSEPDGSESGTEHDSPRGGRPRDEGREQAILDATVELIADVGYDSMSVESVAARAGVSKATIYRRWSGKTELVAEAMRRKHSDKFIEPADTGSLRGDLVALMQALFDSMSGADGGLICGLAVAVRSDAELGRLMSAGKREQQEKVSSLIVSRAKARGEIDAAASPPELMDVALGMALFRLMSGEPLDESFGDYLVDRVLIPVLSK